MKERGRERWNLLDLTEGGLRVAPGGAVSVLFFPRTPVVHRLVRHLAQPTLRDPLQPHCISANSQRTDTTRTHSAAAPFAAHRTDELKVSGTLLRQKTSPVFATQNTTPTHLSPFRLALIPFVASAFPIRRVSAGEEKRTEMCWP